MLAFSGPQLNQSIDHKVRPVVLGYIPQQTNGLAGYFAGSWQFLRKITDKKFGQDAHVEGTAQFSGKGDSLVYFETGTMDLGAYQGQVTQSYIYDFTGPYEANVLFSDRRFFHHLDLKSGQTSISHWCDPDQYDGLYKLHDQREWSLVWTIVGTRKNNIISTIYRRLMS